ncbi:TadE family protein [Streptomyces sp. XD-27]|uniref:TadE family protein n=1 Tax=Streptomyces sp. XD-27 TaxID=3062779 RepID=UPI0026F45781|nr:TadE family protein [Streptomyces sp. XD-27]WKX70955.1 pilus assembly protein [Streptomyces sp. XD-27]
MRRTGALHRAVRRRLDAARGDGGAVVGADGGVRRTSAGRTGAGRTSAGRTSAGRTSDSGMTAIEFVLLTPVLFFLIFATVQFALYFFADHVAQAAAQAGARKARATADENPGGWRGEAEAKARTYIRQLGPQLLIGPDVKTVRPEQNTVGVQVEAKVPTVFPGLNFTVHARSQGPVERFVEDFG